MISEIDIRDWEKAERIIEDVDVIDHDDYKAGALLINDYTFLIDLVRKMKKQYPQVPRLLTAMEASRSILTPYPDMTHVKEEGVGWA